MKQCLLCGNPIDEELSLSFLLSFRAYHRRNVCNRCIKKFVKINPHRCCQYCGKSGHFANRICDDCRTWLKTDTAWFRNRSLYRYNSMMKQYMKQYKFNGDYRLRRVFQRPFKEVVQRTHRLIVPIPLHPATYQRRGFNQVTGLLEGLKVCDVLQTIKDRKDRPQSRKTRRERLRLPQPFRLSQQNAQLIRNRDVVIVDDVYTTGATIRSAARLLKENGAKSVTGLTLAH